MEYEVSVVQRREPPRLCVAAVDDRVRMYVDLLGISELMLISKQADIEKQLQLLHCDESANASRTLY
jgi:hypothetical protein